MISDERFVCWINNIRQTSGPEQYRILESFWESQVKSKQWIINTLKQLNIPCVGDVYIFGGWFGVLGGLLKDSFSDIEEIYSIDLDTSAKIVGEKLNPDVNFVTCDMKNFSFHKQPSLVINTSTEHISQEVFDLWFEKIPKKVPIVLQGNNFFSCEEHVRCSTDLENFKKLNPLDFIVYEGVLDCKQFDRFMIIGHR